MMNKPIAISLIEWREIIEIPEVKAALGLTEVAVEEFASVMHGVKFHFRSGAPGYVGDLYILQSDVLDGDPPRVLTRRNGRLGVEGTRARFEERCREAL